MDDDGDWITARYVLSSILGRNPLVMDSVDEESFPVDPAPPTAAPTSSAPAPPPVRAPAEVAGTVCSVCTEEIAAGDAVVRLPCAHWYHHGCIAPWLGIKATCPLCRAELPPKLAAGEEEGGLAGRVKAAAAGTSDVAGRERRGAAAYEYLAGGGGVMSGWIDGRVGAVAPAAGRVD